MASFGRLGWKVDRLGAGLDEEEGKGEMGVVGRAAAERLAALPVAMVVGRTVDVAVVFFLVAVLVVAVVEERTAVGLAVVRAAFEFRIASSSFLLLLPFTGEHSSLI